MGAKPAITLQEVIDLLPDMTKNPVRLHDLELLLKKYRVKYELTGNRVGYYTLYGLKKRISQYRTGLKPYNTTPGRMAADARIGKKNGGNTTDRHKDLQKMIADVLRKNLDKQVISVDQLSDRFDAPVSIVRDAVNDIAAGGGNIYINERGFIIHTKDIRPMNVMVMDGRRYPKLPQDAAGWYRFGAIGDNHLASKYSRLDILNDIYDRYQAEGIRVVFNTGNWVDGDARFNKHDLEVHGIDAQLNYMLDHYPQRPGITTYFIAGDDHEGWWTQREGINVGQYLMQLAERRGRTDLVFIGYMEQFAVIPARDGKGKTSIHVMHPGGGSAYAISYTVQKIVEAYSEGEKPDMLLAGHYHKADYTVARGVHCFQTACTQDQTPFMRKKRLKAVLGGWIIEFQTHENGAISRVKSEFLNYYNREFYQKWHHRS